MAGWTAALAAGLAVLLAASARAAPPQDARGVFVSHAYALTFTAPPGLFYCPVPDDWTGSDHGTILFLLQPRLCDGVGYPSIARGFEPPGVPRIDVEYERTNGIHHRQRCRGAGRIRFLGHLHRLCAGRWQGMVTRAVRALYVADDETEAIVTLTTYPSRLRRDLVVFRQLAATVHPCSEPWQDAQNRTHIEGSGPRCREDGSFY